MFYMRSGAPWWGTLLLKGLHCHAGGLQRVFERVCWFPRSHRHQCGGPWRLPVFSALSLPGDAMRQVTQLRGAGRLIPACCRALGLCQACANTERFIKKKKVSPPFLGTFRSLIHTSRVMNSRFFGAPQQSNGRRDGGGFLI